MTQRSPADEVRIGQWLSELLLGTRLALTGGRAAWARLMLSAVGIGLGVMVLLLAASVGPAQEAKADRMAARQLETGDPARAGEAEPTHLLARQAAQAWRSTYIQGVELSPVSGGVPKLPPGLDRLPGPGEIIVSPALDRLLAEPGNELLRARLPATIAGHIGEAGLARPGELYFYAGLPEDQRGRALPVLRIGSAPQSTSLPELFQLLLTAAAAALLVPIGVFVLVATQIGAGAREQRLASIRLVGADPGQARRIAAGESLAAALLGLGVGAGLFLLVRSLAAVVQIEQVGFYPADLVPSAPITVLLLFGVPATAVAAALIALRRLEIGPLGVVRKADPPPRRLRWRLALAGLGVLVLAANIPLRRYAREDDWRGTLLSAGIALVLAGAAAVLPWLVERLADRWRPRWVPALLAVRRLRFEYATTRVVAGVVTVLIGAIALQVLLSTIAHTEVSAEGYRGSGSGEVLLVTGGGPDNRPDEARVLEAAGRAPGVVHAGALRSFYAEDSRVLQVADCATIRQLFGVADCRPGTLYQASSWRPVFRPGQVVRLRASGADRPFAWTVPSVRQVSTSSPWLGQNLGSVLVATGTDPRLDAAQANYIWVKGPPGSDLQDRVLAATGRVDLSVRASDMPTREVAAFASVRGGVLAGTAVVVLLALLSLVVAAVDQLQERRRQYSVLAASGVPRRTLGWATLWQNAVPTAIGLALAPPIGIGLAVLVLGVMTSSGSILREIVVNWGDVAMILGAGAALIVLVTLSTLPALRSAVRPSGLRFE
ncbi:FtsX-like permease family protein [Crossiella sp. SN42]|uniref:ABC transporter permease n=1 Tax=Crossiella sp. SN42 TaxID=2944808 RepID=UPI00207C35A2|nr:ABC transporter permease [Crossiella sp. SN42]MCO1579340.1 FtsX-like permease family protein [Crossiella sp. SN42]